MTWETAKCCVDTDADVEGKAEHQDGVVIKINLMLACLDSSTVENKSSQNLRASESTLGFVKTHIPRPYLKSFWFSRSGEGLVNLCISNKFPSDAMLLVQGHILRTTGVETTHSWSPTCGAFKVTPVTTSAEGEGSWGSKWGGLPFGTPKINAAEGVCGSRETQVVLKNRIFKNVEFLLRWWNR